MFNLSDFLPPFPQAISLRELAEATGQPVAYLRDEAQRLYGEGAWVALRKTRGAARAILALSAA